MASAGRILIMPKGEWNTETEYEMLDLVNHNGTSWLAKKVSVNIEPSDANSEYWQNMFDFNADANSGIFADEIICKNEGNLKAIFRKYVSDGDYDYGTEIVDYDSEGRAVKLCLKSYAQDDDVNYIVGVSTKDGEYKRLFGEHNIDLLKELLGLS